MFYYILTFVENYIIFSLLFLGTTLGRLEQARVQAKKILQTHQKHEIEMLHQVSFMKKKENEEEKKEKKEQLILQKNSDQLEMESLRSLTFEMRHEFSCKEW